MDLETIFALIILIYWLLYRLPVIFKRKIEAHVVKNKRLNIVGEIPLLLSLVFYCYVVFTLLRTDVVASNTILLSAIILFIISVIFNEWSRITLGKQWSGAARIINKHDLTTSGPYSIVRHPMYLANIIMMLSGLIVVTTPVTLSIFVVNTIILIYRLRIEEVLLEKEFGEKCHTYKNTTKALIPYIY